MSDVVAFAVPARIVKSDTVLQIAYGVVLEPRTADNPDTQGDFYTADDVRAACWAFGDAVAKAEGFSDLMHDGTSRIGWPRESWIAPEDFTLGDQVVKAGSWVIGMHYPDPEIWAGVVKGDYGAFSVWGAGKRVFG